MPLQSLQKLKGPVYSVQAKAEDGFEGQGRLQAGKDVGDGRCETYPVLSLLLQCKAVVTSCQYSVCSRAILEGCMGCANLGQYSCFDKSEGRQAKKL